MLSCETNEVLNVRATAGCGPAGCGVHAPRAPVDAQLASGHPTVARVGVAHAGARRCDLRARGVDPEWTSDQAEIDIKR